MIANVVGFDLYADDDNDDVTRTLLGNFTADPNTAASTGVLAEVFGFTPTAARYIWMDINSGNGSTFAGFGEAAFEVSAVPVPAAAWLFGSGLLGLIGIARRKNST